MESDWQVTGEGSEPKLVFWYNMPSHHQEDLLREIAVRVDGTILVVYSGRLSTQRQSEGWAVNPSGYRFVYLNGPFGLLGAVRIALRNRHSFHIFGGVFGTFVNLIGAFTTRLIGGNYAIYAEAPSSIIENWYSFGRARASQGFSAKRVIKTFIEKFVVSRSTGGLPISHFSSAWMESAGIPKERIYPFAYFRGDARSSRLPSFSYTSGSCDLMYVGTQDYRKGIDILLDALRPLWTVHPELRLVVVGGKGDASEHLDMDGRILELGPVPSDQILDLMSKSELVVVPSRRDGWGMAVTESLMAGVPVLVSDRCGSADLVYDNVNGKIFKSENAEELRLALSWYLGLPQKEKDRLRAAAIASGERLSVQNAAVYLLESILHMLERSRKKPVPHWLAVMDDGDSRNKITCEN